MSQGCWPPSPQSQRSLGTDPPHLPGSSLHSAREIWGEEEVNGIEITYQFLKTKRLGNPHQGHGIPIHRPESSLKILPYPSFQ